MSTPTPATATPLPPWLMRVYYVFPIVLYVPDAIFNFYVYSDGSGINWSRLDGSAIPLIALWATLSAGVVGMAWLLSVLAPWHWARHHHFQSMMCWLGVVIATSVTIWNSLAYRSIKFIGFPTDTLLPLGGGFSITMILVAVAPPFWGLFWAIVQPATNKVDATAERESHLAKLERLKQEAEIKQLRAESNATVRAAQITGLAATARAARSQLGARRSIPDPEVPTALTTVIETPDEDASPPEELAAIQPPVGRRVITPLRRVAGK